MGSKPMAQASRDQMMPTMPHFLELIADDAGQEERLVGREGNGLASSLLWSAKVVAERDKIG